MEEIATDGPTATAPGAIATGPDPSVKGEELCDDAGDEDNAGGDDNPGRDGFPVALPPVVESARLFIDLRIFRPADRADHRPAARPQRHEKHERHQRRQQIGQQAARNQAAHQTE